MVEPIIMDSCIAIKDITGYEGLFSIDELGRMWNYRLQRYMRPQLSKDGYLVVSTTVDWKRKVFRVHRLLGISFIPNPNRFPEVLHGNDVKTDNWLGNLRWGTYSDNIADAKRNLDIQYARDEKSSRGKLTKEDKASIIERYSRGGITQQKLAEEYGVNSSQISRLIHYKGEYKDPRHQS
jgi:hypothetical protein